MTTPLAALLLAALGAAAPAGSPAPEWETTSPPRSPVVRHEEPAAEKPAARLDRADDVAALCRTLVPAERVRPAGDAVERGEEEARQATARGAALKERYAVRVPAAKLAFAPYDGPERRLALQEPVQLPVADGTARLWPTERRDLAVEADAAAARRVLDAQRRGALALEIAFELPEDATCGSGARGKKFTIPVDPVSWRWLDGDDVLAQGGAAAERPLVSAARGARPRVDVGDPISGPLHASKLVLARGLELEACYLEALKRNPGADGVLVADIGGARTAISADSVGDEELAVCVQKALGPLAAGARAAVPIRFELAPPGPEPATPR
ncbi:MAG TPA: hypothetical protein VFL83_06910 [Anaeromyxobacter sp.]|nr:hypothetical protein [Anaeromyxobacter sp.]